MGRGSGFVRLTFPCSIQTHPDACGVSEKVGVSGAASGRLPGGRVQLGGSASPLRRPGRLLSRAGLWKSRILTVATAQTLDP